MDISKVKRISLIDDKENKLNNEILKEYVVVTSDTNSDIKDTNISEICIFNGGACLITYVGDVKEQEVDSFSLDIPSGVGFVSSHAKCKKFFSDIDYMTTSEIETQRVVQIYQDGKTIFPITAIVEYYEAENSENAWKLFDENGLLI